VTDLPVAGLVKVTVPRPVDLNSGNPLLASRCWSLAMKSMVMVSGMSQTVSEKVSTMCWWDRSISFAAAGWTMARSRP
jgi:hypothetical protein